MYILEKRYCFENDFDYLRARERRWRILFSLFSVFGGNLFFDPPNITYFGLSPH